MNCDSETNVAVINNHCMEISPTLNKTEASVLLKSREFQYWNVSVYYFLLPYDVGITYARLRI